MHKKTVKIITGPTASGKSGVAKKQAMEENGVVINCDSMQVYDVLRIITARPSVKDENEAEHKLYGYLSPSVACNVSKWRKDALKEIDDAISKGKVPIVVGGTGMYIKALVEGLSPVPDIEEEIRNKVRNDAKEKGPNFLHEKLADEDKIRLNKNDSQRISRALEVYSQTGKSLSWWNEKTNVGIRDDLDFDFQVIIPNQDVLEKKISSRFYEMVEEGAIEEVEKILAMNLDESLPAMKAIGVLPIKNYLEGKISKQEMIDTGIIQTRQYAKRQVTWIKSQFFAKFK